jgi:hypothetical protein
MKNGVSATFTDSDISDEVDEEIKEIPTGDENNYEKKRRKRTKEDIERELLEKGDLYAILEL